MLPKQLDSGDIGYIVLGRPSDRRILPCVVDCYCSCCGKYRVDVLEARERRLVNGIPINEFKTTEWKKLPKGWTYNTPLHTLEWDNSFDQEFEKIRLDDTTSIKEAYDKGLLVKAKDKLPQCMYPEDEIDRTKGYRTKLRHNLNQVRWEEHTISIEREKIFIKYEDAKASIDEENAELNRQMSLTDEQWSIEQIKKTVDRWAAGYGIEEDNKNQYMQWILGLPKIEDVVVRQYMGCLEWRYEKNKRWNAIVL